MNTVAYQLTTTANDIAKSSAIIEYAAKELEAMRTIEQEYKKFLASVK